MKYGLITIAYLLIMISVALVPNPIKGEGVNYILHSIEFFMFSALVFLTAIANKKKHPYIIAVFISIICAILLEAAQYFVPYRTFNMMDIAAGTLGSLVILFIKEH